MLFGAGSFKTPLDQRRLGTEEFCFFPPVYHVCVCVYMREPACAPFADAIIP